MNRFGYYQPPAYAYAEIDPAKFRFANVPHFRPPTPPIFLPPKDPHAPEEPENEETPASEDKTGDSQAEDAGETPASEDKTGDALAEDAGETPPEEGGT